MGDRTGTMLATYCAEMRELSRRLGALLDVAERRSDLNALEDGTSLAELERVVDELRDRLRRTKAQRMTPGTDIRVREETFRPLDIQNEITIQELSEPSVQATASEILDLRGAGSDDDLRARVRHSLGAGSVAYDDADDLVDELTAGEEHPSAPVEPDQTLATLLEHVGSWASLQGTTASMPISSLFALVADGKKTGCLHLRRTDEHLRFVFAAGLVVATATTRPPPDQLIGEILVARNVISSERRQDLLDLAKSRRKPFGAVAVETGYLTVDQLTKALQMQVQDRFDRVFRDPHVAYAFVPSQGEDSDGRVRVNARALLFESARRSDEATRVP